MLGLIQKTEHIWPNEIPATDEMPLRRNGTAVENGSWWGWVGTQQTVRWGGWWGFVLFAVSVASTMTSCAETGCVHRGLFCCGEKRRSGNKNQVKIIAQHKVNSRYWKTEAPAKGHAHHPKLRGKENNRKVCKMNRSLSCLVTKKPKPEVKAKSKPLEKHPHI